MSDKMREEFEAYSGEHEFLSVCPVERSVSGKYKDFDLQCAWETWQASRESLVIELPALKKPTSWESYDNAWNTTIGECRKAIEAAGLKVKP